MGTAACATSGPSGSALGAAPSPDKSAERVCLFTASASVATDALPGVIPPYPPRAPEASAAPSGYVGERPPPRPLTQGASQHRGSWGSRRVVSTHFQDAFLFFLCHDIQGERIGRHLGQTSLHSHPWHALMKPDLQEGERPSGHRGQPRTRWDQGLPGTQFCQERPAEQG